MNKEKIASKLTKKASKKLLDGAKTAEGMSAIGGAATGGLLGGSIGIVGSFAGVAISGISGVLPVALVGAGIGYAGTKLIKNRSKIKRLEKEIKKIKTPKIENSDGDLV